MLKINYTSVRACLPLLQRGPKGVRGHHHPKESVLSKQQMRPIPSYSYYRNTFLQSPSVHHGCQVKVVSCKKVPMEINRD